MYRPEAFREDDRATLYAHAAANPFATVCTQREGRVEVSHLPLVVDAERGSLRGHLARDNPMLAHLEAGAEALAVFHGPHGYVSPSVYGRHPSVPTWNYVVVHARGPVRLLDGAGLRAVLGELVARFDTTGWRFEGHEDEEYERRMLGAIAGFEIAVASLEGKWKLSQNRPRSDQERVVEWLARSDGDDASRALAALMKERLPALATQA
jgi:transcriptional regulator